MDKKGIVFVEKSYDGGPKKHTRQFMVRYGTVPYRYHVLHRYNCTLSLEREIRRLVVVAVIYFVRTVPYIFVCMCVFYDKK